MTTPLPTRIARHNRYLAVAIDGLPRYNEMLEIADVAQRELDALQPVPSVPAEIDPINCGQITGEWIERSLDYQTGIARLEARRNLLAELKRNADGNAAGIYVANIDGMLTGPHGEPMSLLEPVSEIAASWAAHRPPRMRSRKTKVRNGSA